MQFEVDRVGKAFPEQKERVGVEKSDLQVLLVMWLVRLSLDLFVLVYHLTTTSESPRLQVMDELVDMADVELAGGAREAPQE